MFRDEKWKQPNISPETDVPELIEPNKWLVFAKINQHTTTKKTSSAFFNCRLMYFSKRLKNDQPEFFHNVPVSSIWLSTR